MEFWEKREWAWSQRVRHEDQWDEMRSVYKELLDSIKLIDDQKCYQYLKNRIDEIGQVLSNIKKLTQFQ
jgi:asparagine synthetase A